MSNTGRKNKGNILVYTLSGVDQEFFIPLNSTAQDVLNIVNPSVSENLTLAEAQRWLDEQFSLCDGSEDCTDCLTCLEPLPLNDVYHDFETVVPNSVTTSPSAFLEIAGEPVCWKLEIQKQ